MLIFVSANQIGPILAVSWSLWRMILMFQTLHIQCQILVSVNLISAKKMRIMKRQLRNFFENVE